MGVLLTKLLGAAILFGVPAFIVAYVISPTFRNLIYQLTMGT